MDSSRRHDERSVSNLVGIVVLVTVTIFVAGTAGVLVMVYETEDLTTDNPQASFEYDFSFNPDGPDSLTIRHQDGDGIPGEHIRVEIEGTNDRDADGHYRWLEIGGPQEVTPGASIMINGATLDAEVDQLELDEAEVRIVVEDEDSGRTYRVARWSGPNA